jgi:ATP synthase protein I
VASLPNPSPAKNGRQNGWDDLEDDPANAPVRPLTREEAAALRAKEPPVSPWRVIAAQAAVGVVLALIGRLVTGKEEVAWSLLYGAATAVVPGALMARGMTSRLSSVSLGGAAVSFMLWEFVKIGVSVAMLALAGRIVQPLSWPALLVGLVVCIKVYWFALLWRGRAK